MEGKIEAKPRRKKDQRENDLLFITPLMLKGSGLRQMADALSAVRDYRIDTSMIFRDVKEIQSRWQEESIGMIDKAKAIELAKINNLERTYWEAWEESKRSKVKTVNKQRGTTAKDKAPGKADVMAFQSEKHTMEAVGDPRWLDGIQWCIQQRCKLFGFDQAGQLPVATTAPVARTVIFETRSRRNEAIQEAEVISSTPIQQ